MEEDVVSRTSISFLTLIFLLPFYLLPSVSFGVRNSMRVLFAWEERMQQRHDSMEPFS